MLACHFGRDPAFVSWALVLAEEALPRTLHLPPAIREMWKKVLSSQVEPQYNGNFLVVSFTRKLTGNKTTKACRAQAADPDRDESGCPSYRALGYHLLTSSLRGLSCLKMLRCRSGPGVGVLWSAGQPWLAAYFCRFIGTQPPSFITCCLWLLSCCQSRAEYCDRDCMGHRIKNIDSLSLTEKAC